MRTPTPGRATPTRPEGALPPPPDLPVASVGRFVSGPAAIRR
jgi:hypothetical protein